MGGRGQHLRRADTMTRSILTALIATFAIAAVAGSGCAPTGIGDPCTPEQEFDPQFIGFNFHEVSTESKSFQCMTRVCLVNHFQGRVSCQYGQAPDGTPLPNTVAECNDSSGNGAGCCTPGIPLPVTGQLDANGQPTDQTLLKTVMGQCTKRTADQAVYCSCRCANGNGGTDDGAVYCQCPDGFSCTQLVSAIQSSSVQTAQDKGLTGAYCIKNGTQYNPNQGCTACDPNLGGCGGPQKLAKQP
jgi:hypothetical protein